MPSLKFHFKLITLLKRQSFSHCVLLVISVGDGQPSNRSKMNAETCKGQKSLTYFEKDFIGSAVDLFKLKIGNTLHLCSSCFIEPIRTAILILKFDKTFQKQKRIMGMVSRYLILKSCHFNNSTVRILHLY